MSDLSVSDRIVEVREVGPVADAFFHNLGYVDAIMGPVGSGKSSVCARKLMALAGAQRRSPIDGVRYSRWVIARNTYPELKSTTIKTWLEWFPEHLFGKMRWDVPITHHVRVVDDEDGSQVDAEFMFLSLDKEADVKKLLSLEITGAWVNEAREVPIEVIEGLILRVGRYPPKRHGGPSWSGLLLDTNPPPEGHWYYTKSEENTPDGWRFFRQPGALIEKRDRLGNVIAYEPNPAAENVHNQPLGYEYWLRQIGSLDAEKIRVFLLGEYGLGAGRSIFDRQKLREARAECFRPLYRAEVTLGGSIEKREDGRLLVFREPKAGERYVIGADVAEGLEHGDYSCADVLRYPDGAQVAHWHGHIDPDQFGDVCFALGRWYHDALLGVERNNHGLTTLTRLRNRNYKRLYVQEDLEHRSGKPTKKLGWQTTQKSKCKIIDQLAAEIREGTARISCVDTIREMMTFIQDEKGKLRAMDGCHDDRVMARAIAGEMLLHVPRQHQAPAAQQKADKWGMVR
ncbi:MAG TPA: hypothetical protein VF161_10505 [Steroidobacteraceae bacterium]